MIETCERCGRKIGAEPAQQHRPIWGYAAGALCDTCYGWALCQQELGDEFEHRASHPASGEPATPPSPAGAPEVASPHAPFNRPACDLIHEDSFFWPTPSPSGSAAHVALWQDGSLTVCVEPDESRLLLSGSPREVLARLLALAYAAATMAKAYDVASMSSEPFAQALAAVRASTGEPSEGGMLYTWRADEIAGYISPATDNVHNYSRVFGKMTQVYCADDGEMLCDQLHLLWHITANPTSKALPLDACK